MGTGMIKNMEIKIESCSAFILVCVLASCAVQPREIPFSFPSSYRQMRVESHPEVALIDIAELDSSIGLDIRYATENNFTGKKIYPSARAFLQREAAMALVRANQSLGTRGFRLKVFDAYRPYSVQKRLWQIVPDERYVANPRYGSIHNRAMAVDVTLTDLKGNDVAMPTGFDDFSERAGRTYRNLPPDAIRNRKILDQAMIQEGFCPIPAEWWHFDYQGWSKHPLLDIPLPANKSLDGAT